MQQNFVTVTDFCTVINRIFKSEEMLRNIAVMGEVSGFRVSGGHAYFTMKDQNAALQCTCFSCAKTYIPKDGESIIAIGTPDYYVKGGRFSFVISKIEPYGLGLLFQRIEELKKRLTAEGIFDEAHKISIPKFCKSICVVTSKTGAVIRDICKTVRLKNPIIDITVKDVRVQGIGADKEIADALAAVDKLDYDCVILARGGGSLEDLMPFYSEISVRAVYNMKTPIISAVGHETDFSLCDFAADYRAATPTAAGEAVAFDYYEVLKNIQNSLKTAHASLINNLNTKISGTRYLASSLSYKMQNMYKQNLNRLKIADINLIKAVNDNLTLKTHLIDKALISLDNLSPVRVLKSGYFRLYSGDMPVTSVKSVKVGEDIRLRGADGRITAKVTDVEETDI